MMTPSKDLEWLKSKSDAEAACPSVAVGGMDAIKELSRLLEASGLTVRFGLRQQGHIPTVEFMLMTGATWDEIGRAVGWQGEAARHWYTIVDPEVKRADQPAPKED